MSIHEQFTIKTAFPNQTQSSLIKLFSEAGVTLQTTTFCNFSQGFAKRRPVFSRSGYYFDAL